MQTERSHRKPAAEVEVTHGRAASVRPVEQLVLHSWQLKAWQEGSSLAEQHSHWFSVCTLDGGQLDAGWDRKFEGLTVMLSVGEAADR